MGKASEYEIKNIKTGKKQTVKGQKKVAETVGVTHSAVEHHFTRNKETERVFNNKFLVTKIVEK